MGRKPLNLVESYSLIPGTLAHRIGTLIDEDGRGVGPISEAATGSRDMIRDLLRRPNRKWPKNLLESLAPVLGKTPEELLTGSTSSQPSERPPPRLLNPSESIRIEKSRAGWPLWRKGNFVVVNQSRRVEFGDICFRRQRIGDTWIIDPSRVFQCYEERRLPQPDGDAACDMFVVAVLLKPYDDGEPIAEIVGFSLDKWHDQYEIVKIIGIEAQ